MMFAEPADNMRLVVERMTQKVADFRDSTMVHGDLNRRRSGLSAEPRRQQTD